MEWEFTADTPLTIHALRKILDSLPGATPICIATTDDLDSEPVSNVDFNLAIYTNPHWTCGTNDPEVEKVAILTFRA